MMTLVVVHLHSYRFKLLKIAENFMRTAVCETFHVSNIFLY